MKTIYTLMSLLFILLFVQCGMNPEEKQLQTFLNEHVQNIKPLLKKSALAYWDAANTGDEKAYATYAEMQLKIKKNYSDPNTYAYLKSLKENHAIDDPLLKRQLEVELNQYVENQIDSTLMAKIVQMETDIDKTFSSFRGTIKGKTATNSEINQILKTETDNRLRKLAWLASKQVGPEISEDLIKLVKLRNKAAQSVGFDNFHTMRLTLDEQNVDQLTQIFDELYGLTYESFNAMKTELDAILAEQLHVDPKEMKPWHYHDPFFQETPLVYEVDLDAYYKNQSIETLATDYYAGIGLDVKPILANSDLYEREGKNPHAFCIDIDREGDVRTLCNLQDNERWMETLLHELGHGVYDLYQDPNAPFLLRTPAHAFTTEAVAMFFGRLSRDASWMQLMLDLPDAKKEEIQTITVKYAQMKQLIFARWAMVMFHFEKNLYANPDQDLNQLWWDLVEKYQRVKKPEGRNEPDWATKIHVALYPCYYHNYLLGELLASQFDAYIKKEILTESDQTFANNIMIGDYLTEQVFKAGNLYHWDTMIEKATGEPLNPKFFVDQFVNK